MLVISRRDGAVYVDDLLNIFANLDPQCVNTESFQAAFFVPLFSD
jgi:hypothetical protein